MAWHRLGIWAARVRHPLLIVPLFLMVWFGWQVCGGFGRAMLTVAFAAVAGHLLPDSEAGSDGVSWDDDG